LNFKRLFSGNRDVFGLDVGLSYVKAVQLRQDENGYSVIAAGRTEVMGDGADDRAKINNLVTAIRKCVKSARIKTKHAVCGICGPSVALRPFKLPVMETKEIEEAVLSEAEQVCPFERGQFIVDYQLFHNARGKLQESANSQQNNKIQGVFAAAATNMIGYKNQLVKAASLNCVLMDVDGLALLNCFLECEKPERSETIAILGVGEAFTNLVISGSNGTPFVRDIPHAADEIINHVAGEHNLSGQAARDILCGSPDKDIGEFKGSLERSSAKLIADIAQTLRYYTVEEGQGVAKIFVCGGFAGTNGFIELLNNQLPLEVVLWNPFNKMRYGGAAHGIEMLKEQGFALALAAGLAMRTI
jgi:type IV pilus assembly protein PilM